MYIDVPDLNDSFSKCVIDGAEWNLKFAWNAESEYWTFGVWKNTDTAIFTGVKIVPDFPVNNYYRSFDLPNGIFGAVCKKGVEKIGRGDFRNGNARFAYIPKNELSDEAKLYA